MEGIVDIFCHSHPNCIRCNRTLIAIPLFFRLFWYQLIPCEIDSGLNQGRFCILMCEPFWLVRICLLFKAARNGSKTKNTTPLYRTVPILILLLLLPLLLLLLLLLLFLLLMFINNVASISVDERSQPSKRIVVTIWSSKESPVRTIVSGKVKYPAYISSQHLFNRFLLL